MREVLHIFRKDVREHIYEIGLLLVLTAVWVGVGPSNLGRATSVDIREFFAWLVWLMVIAWWVLIARLIQGEPLTDDRAFWLTRPYGRWRLFAAKALSVVAFVNLPLLIAQTVFIAGAGFSPGRYIAGLAWEQVLITAFLVLPAVALATLTSTAAQFLLGALSVPRCC